MTPSSHVIIIGGGAIGSAIAYFLSADPGFTGEVTVVERDPTYQNASSALSASSIRQQFSTPVNIQMSRFSIDFFRTLDEQLRVGSEKPSIGFVESGYLLLATPSNEEQLVKNNELQRKHGVDVTLLSADALEDRFPWLSVDGIALGSLGGSGEGWFDGYLLLQAFRTKARSLGVRYVSGEVVNCRKHGSQVASVLLADGQVLNGSAFVNAAGPWAAKVAQLFDIEIPVRARRRCVFTFNSPCDSKAWPFLIDPSGVWVRPEGNGFIAGVAPPEDDDPDNAPLTVDMALFENIVWPALAERVPAFNELRLTHSWAGYYEVNTLDHNGIIGAHNSLQNLFFANGFSGHGLMQAPAVGRAIAELIIYNSFRTIDLTALGPARIARNEPYRELNVF